MTNTLLWDSLAIFLLNIPFGYWRINVRKFSIHWVLAIHIPVAVIIALRFLTPIGFEWCTYIFTVAAFFLGQRLGSGISNIFRKLGKDTTSCLVMDIYRFKRP